MFNNLLIANRGEIAIRIARTASDLGIATVAIYAEDDAASLHLKMADRAVGLGAEGVAAYLDIERIVAVAREAGCDAIHPGYGFLSENAAFAAACHTAGLTFIGPSEAVLEQLGDKARARSLARSMGAPVLPGLDRAVSLEEASAFLGGLGPTGAVMVKALAGGGGRGMRPVERMDDLPEAYARCASEARQAFGSGDLYVEELFTRARHVEVQIVGDGTGAVTHLWDRECSLQRQRQKVIEVAPAFALPEALRTEMLEAAVRIGVAVRYRGVGTVEFLVDVAPGAPSRFAFIEANARLQVEHTVTEAVTGLDLVGLQLRIAAGATLADLGLGETPPAPQGVAIQARVNLETVTADGTVRPGGGLLSAYEPPSGPGVRVDGFGYVGYETSSRYDPLLAKVIVHAPDLPRAVAKSDRALSEFKLAGARANIGFLRAILASPAVREGELHTRYVEQHLAELLAAPIGPSRFVQEDDRDQHLAGARVDPDDPLAVLSVKRPARTRQSVRPAQGPDGTTAAMAPLQGLIVSIVVKPGDTVRRGQQVALMEALKMEHAVPAPVSGVVRDVVLEIGDSVLEGAPILYLEPTEVEDDEVVEQAVIDLDALRPDVAEVLRFHALTTDAMRPEATVRRHTGNKRTARENITDLCDAGSFLEYGPLVTAGRLRRDTPEDIEERIRKTAADGMVMGVGRVNGDLFEGDAARCAVMSYDYTVLAGTQGIKNHQKTDRMLGIAKQAKLPLVFYTEGGGGRTSGERGETPASAVGTLNVRSWRELGKLSGLVPIVGVNSGYCFAGNVVLLGACDVIIATEDSSLGIGGPAVIEGGGLGVYAPDEVGPVSVQQPNGVIDILVEDEAAATRAAKHYLSFFQGRVGAWTAPDQRILRHIVPQNRRAVYDIRKVIETLGDVGSMLELRPKFGLSMVTAFIRVEGRPMGVVANNSNSPTGGAIDADGADKAARFLQLCDAFDIPILSLIDTPGNMVGPEAEKTALIRHCGRMYVAGANLSVPMYSVVLRKAYGLGALAMSAGSFDQTYFTVSWPTGEFAGMGLEAAIKLGRRAELQAITNLAERKARYETLLAQAYEWASALNAGMIMEVDDVIDPADTRRWLVMGLESAAAPPPRAGKKRAWIDTW